MYDCTYNQFFWDRTVGLTKDSYRSVAVLGLTDILNEFHRVSLIDQYTPESVEQSV